MAGALEAFVTLNVKVGMPEQKKPDTLSTSVAKKYATTEFLKAKTAYYIRPFTIYYLQLHFGRE